jgi:ALG3 protein
MRARAAALSAGIYSDGERGSVATAPPLFCRSLRKWRSRPAVHTAPSTATPCALSRSLPLLLWSTDLPTPARLAVLAAVEGAFNVFPATAASSAALTAAHAALLAALWAAPAPRAWLPVASPRRA